MDEVVFTLLHMSNNAYNWLITLFNEHSLHSSNRPDVHAEEHHSQHNTRIIRGQFSQSQVIIACQKLIEFDNDTYLFAGQQW